LIHDIVVMCRRTKGVRESIAIIPPHRWAEGIELLASRLPQEAQRQQRLALRAALAADSRQAAGMLGYFRGESLTAACWLQEQQGRVANLWPPVFSNETDLEVATALINRAIETARAAGAVMVQSLLATDAGAEAEWLKTAGFQHIADLLYLVSAAGFFPSSLPQSDLDFSPLPHDAASRLERLIERTYDGTRDCPAMNGVRAIGDVVKGYQGVGRFRPDLWLIARLENHEVGCALIADHSPESAWELLYMGIVPEARGIHLGLELTRYVQWLAASEKVKRLVLAVDAANEPAIAMYAAAGFAAWDRRSVFVWVI
jgi:RimJ/RimL family protein N-acetyltransferase